MNAAPANVKVGDLVIVTCDNWFYAPDGHCYRAVFGRVKAVCTAEDTLGVRPNGKSTNWYMEVGNLTIAGCQVHYVMRTDTCSFGQTEEYLEHQGQRMPYMRNTVIYDASRE